MQTYQVPIMQLLLVCGGLELTTQVLFQELVLLLLMVQETLP